MVGDHAKILGKESGDGARSHFAPVSDGLSSDEHGKECDSGFVTRGDRWENQAIATGVGSCRDRIAAHRLYQFDKLALRQKCFAVTGDRSAKGVGSRTRANRAATAGGMRTAFGDRWRLGNYPCHAIDKARQDVGE